MRVLYSLLLYLLLPGVLLRLWLKGRRMPAYRRHWRERLGLDVPRTDGAVWLHAVSVGEVRAAEPLVRALLARKPAQPLLITVMTPTGRQTVRQLFGNSVLCRYLPYDLPGPVQRFLSALQPVMAIFMEVELWPNLYAGLAARGVPLYLVNARLSENSLRGYQRLGNLIRRTLCAVKHIAAQTEVDKARFVQLGVAAENVSVAGNLKCDARLPTDLATRAQQLREQLSTRQPIWVAASTHEGEEAVALEAHVALLQQYPHALLILAPRHPERAATVVRQCDRKGLNCRLFSASPFADASVLLIDQLGQLVYCYAIADVAFVGGSLVDKGGHNPIEAVLAETPVISGVHLNNFADIYAQLQQAGAAVSIASAAELATRLYAWCSDVGAREQAISAGKKVVRTNRGALARVLTVIDSQA
jgi:3-deoxy-D-manno-octulosonic-acid transferase